MQGFVRVFNTFITPGINWQALYHEYNTRGIPIKTCATNANYRLDVAIDARNVEIVNVPKVFHKRKMFVHAYFSVIALIKILFGPKPTMNVFLTQPQLFFVAGAWASRMRGVPYVVHIMDMYPEILAEVGMIEKSSWVYRFSRRKASKALNQASAIICIGRCMIDRLEENNVQQVPLSIIRNFSSKNYIAVPRRENLFIDKLGIQDAFIVLYMGNMGIAHEFSTVKECARSLEETHPTIKFVFVGRGLRRKEIEEVADRPNILLVGYLEDEVFRHALSAGDIHLITLRKGFEGLLVPSKFYSSIEAGRPVLYEGVSSGEISRTIDEHELGTTVPDGDVEKFRDSVIRYYNDRQLVLEHGANARKYHVAQGAIDRIGSQYYAATQASEKHVVHTE